MKPTARRDEVSPRALDLVAALRDCLRNEEAWAVAQGFLDAERGEGGREALEARSLTPDWP